MPNRINFATFGSEFIRQVLTPLRLQEQLTKAMPSQISGSAPLTDIGVGTAEYTASIRPLSVHPGSRLGTFQVFIPIHFDLTLKAIASKNFQIQALVNFWLITETYDRVVVFINYAATSADQVQLTSLSDVSGIIDSKIWEQVQAQMRPLIAEQINNQLRDSYDDRMIDILKLMGNAQATHHLECANFVSQFTDFSADLKSADEEPAGHYAAHRELNDSLDTIETPSDLSGTEQLSSLNLDSQAAAYTAAQPISYELFGRNFFGYIVTPQLLKTEIDNAIRNQSFKRVVKSDIHLGIATASIVPCKTAFQNMTDDALELRAWIDIHINVQAYIGHVWLEAWLLKVTVPLGFIGCAYDNPLTVFLAAYELRPEYLTIQSTQQTNTGIAWSTVESEVRKAITEELNKAVKDSHDLRKRHILKEVDNAIG